MGNLEWLCNYKCYYKLNLHTWYYYLVFIISNKIITSPWSSSSAMSTSSSSLHSSPFCSVMGCSCCWSAVAVSMVCVSCLDEASFICSYKSASVLSISSSYVKKKLSLAIQYICILWQVILAGVKFCDVVPKNFAKILQIIILALAEWCTRYCSS